MMRVFISLLFGLFFVAAAEAQDDKTVRFGFFPPLNEDIVFRVDYRHEQTLFGEKRALAWTHEVHLHLTEKQVPDLIAGTFSMRGVTMQAGDADDLYYLIAKAVEDETYSIKMLDLGAPVEVDWVSISARVHEHLPRLAGPALATAIEGVLPLFEPDGVKAVLRPFWVTSMAHLRAFNKDGSPTTVSNLELPTYYAVKESTMESYGGREDGTDDYFFAWRITPEPQAAAKVLGGQLLSLMAQVTGPAERAKGQVMLEQALAGGLEAVEGGIATYDLTPGLMRVIKFEARLSAGEISRNTTITITRLKPE